MFRHPQKAFHKIWQNGLVDKLYQKGLNQHLWKIISDLIRDVQCCIHIAGMRSDWFQTEQKCTPRRISFRVITPVVH